MMRKSNLVWIGFFSLVCLAAYLRGENESAKTSDLRLSQMAGPELFSKKNCTGCHTLSKEADGKLTPVPKKREDDWFTQHVSENSELVIASDKSAGKKRRILRKEVAALSGFLFDSSDKQKTRILGLRAEIREGSYLAYQNNCTNCHKIAGEGKEIGPDLSFVADRRSEKSWLIKNLKNPQQFAEDSPMPAFEGKIPEQQLAKIADYRLTLRK